MKALLLTEGGKNIGFGHLARCISLYQAFEEGGVSSEIVVNGNETTKALLEGTKNRSFDWLGDKKKAFNLIQSADITVIDSYSAKFDFYKQVSEFVDIPVYIDDYKRINYPRGIIVNGSIYAKELNYPYNEELVYLLGCEYVPLRREFWKVPQKTINKEIKKILVTFGGMEHSELLYRIVSYLRNKFSFDCYLVDPAKKALDVEEMFDLMLQADICISGGGQTTYELARLGVPTIGICLFDNQRLQLEHFHKKGFLEYIGWQNDAGLLNRLSGALTGLISYEERLKRSNLGRTLVDGKGARRIRDRLNEE